MFRYSINAAALLIIVVILSGCNTSYENHAPSEQSSKDVDHVESFSNMNSTQVENTSTEAYPSPTPVINTEIENLLSSLISRQEPDMDKIREGLSACEKLNDDLEKGFCIGRLAYKERYRPLCRNITLEKLRDWCISNFINIETDHDLCYEISDRDLRYFCFGSMDNNITACHLVRSKLNRALCIENIAVAKNDRDLCEKIENKKIRGECMDKLA